MSRCKFLKSLDAPWFRCEWKCTVTQKEYDSDHDDQKYFVQTICDTDKHYDCPYYKKNA